MLDLMSSLKLWKKHICIYDTKNWPVCAYLHSIIVIFSSSITNNTSLAIDLAAMEHVLRDTWTNVIRLVIKLYLSLWKTCALAKKISSKGLVTKPIISRSMNSRCQVDLIDMQSRPDGEYKWILDYQDHLTKYTCLHPLKTKKAKEVSDKLIIIFSEFCAPCILQSDNGREFRNKLIKSLEKKYVRLKMVHGTPKHSQSQGSVERNNREVKKITIAWMNDNNTTNWAKGLTVVASEQNRALNNGIGRSPNEAMHGGPLMYGLADRLIPSEFMSNLETCEDLENILEENFDDLERTFQGIH